MVNCGACGKFLPATGGAACSICSVKYHKGCLALPDKAQINKDWVCPNCKKGVRRGDNSQIPDKGVYSTPPQGVSSPSSPQCDDRREDPRDREFAVFMAEFREFRKEMNQLRESLNTRLNDLEQRLDALEKRGHEVVSGGTAELERTIENLKRELNDRDQEALLADLDIGQLPEEKGVSVIQTVTVLAAQLGVQLEERDVVFAERVGAPPAEAGGRPRRVVVRLQRRHLRDELLRAARVRRAGLASAAGPRIFINERLTRSNRQLFYCVREECRRLQWRYCWTRRGRIFARQGDGLPAFQFHSEVDLTRAFGPRELPRPAVAPQ